MAGKHRKTYYVGTERLSYVLKLLVQRRNNFRAISKFLGNHVKENKLSKTTNDVLAKIYILPVYYKNECSHGCMLTGTVN